jgi:xeroderma pigmentosum group C-complementing protein
LFALNRHLLKYEAFYPPEPPILGYIREEAIYPRDCVFVLHTRETWLKEAKVVKINEKPYKNTKTLKWDNVTRKLLKDVPQELFGIWQTKDYEPPVAKDGMVPRNAYGNVELFKPCMLPIGTVHLQLPGLNKVCKKIGVDCSTAIVGFDSNGGWPYPVYDGFIVCEEFQEKVIDAWNREQEEIERKENEKYEKRVYGNWKKLIQGLRIRERLKNKYNFEGDAAN